MASYSIKIINESGDVQSYLLFQEAPAIQEIPASQVFTNVYQTAPRTQSGQESHAIFRMSNDFYCVSGTNPNSLAINNYVTTNSAVKVNLAEGNVPGSVFFLTAPDETPEWDMSKTSTTSSADAFSVQTDTNFKYPNQNNIFIGLGGQNPYENSDIIPTATFEVSPDKHYTMWPKAKYYVTLGEFNVGTVLDFQALGEVLEVDFHNGLRDRTFIHTANGTFEPQ